MEINYVDEFTSWEGFNNKLINLNKMKGGSFNSCPKTDPSGFIINKKSCPKTDPNGFINKNCDSGLTKTLGTVKDKYIKDLEVLKKDASPDMLIKIQSLIDELTKIESEKKIDEDKLKKKNEEIQIEIESVKKTVLDNKKNLSANPTANPTANPAATAISSAKPAANPAATAKPATSGAAKTISDIIIEIESFVDKTLNEEVYDELLYLAKESKDPNITQQKANDLFSRAEVLYNKPYVQISDTFLDESNKEINNSDLLLDNKIIVYNATIMYYGNVNTVTLNKDDQYIVNNAVNRLTYKNNVAVLYYNGIPIYPSKMVLPLPTGHSKITIKDVVLDDDSDDTTNAGADGKASNSIFKTIGTPVNLTATTKNKTPVNTSAVDTSAVDPTATTKNKTPVNTSAVDTSVDTSAVGNAVTTDELCKLVKDDTSNNVVDKYNNIEPKLRLNQKYKDIVSFISRKTLQNENDLNNLSVNNSYEKLFIPLPKINQKSKLDNYDDIMQFLKELPNIPLRKTDFDNILLLFDSLYKNNPSIINLIITTFKLKLRKSYLDYDLKKSNFSEKISSNSTIDNTFYINIDLTKISDPVQEVQSIFGLFDDYKSNLLHHIYNICALYLFTKNNNFILTPKYIDYVSLLDKIETIDDLILCFTLFNIIFDTKYDTNKLIELVSDNKLYKYKTPYIFSEINSNKTFKKSINIFKPQYSGFYDFSLFDDKKQFSLENDDKTVNANIKDYKLEQFYLDINMFLHAYVYNSKNPLFKVFKELYKNKLIELPKLEFPSGSNESDDDKILAFYKTTDIIPTKYGSLQVILDKNTKNIDKMVKLNLNDVNNKTDLMSGKKLTTNQNYYFNLINNPKNKENDSINELREKKYEIIFEKDQIPYIYHENLFKLFLTQNPTDDIINKYIIQKKLNNKDKKYLFAKYNQIDEDKQIVIDLINKECTNPLGLGLSIGGNGLKQYISQIYGEGKTFDEVRNMILGNMDENEYRTLTGNGARKVRSKSRSSTKSKSRSSSKSKSRSPSKSSKKKIKLSEIIKKIIDKYNKDGTILTGYNKDIQEMYFSHLLSYIVLENKVNVEITDSYLENELITYLKKNKSNLDNNINLYLVQVKRNLEKLKDNSSNYIYNFNTSDESDYNSD